MYSESIDPVRA